MVLQLEPTCTQLRALTLGQSLSAQLASKSCCGARVAAVVVAQQQPVVLARVAAVAVVVRVRGKHSTPRTLAQRKLLRSAQAVQAVQPHS